MTFIISLAVTLFILIVALWLVAHFLLSGEDFSEYDSTIEKAADNIFSSHADDSEHDKKIITKLAQARQGAIETKSITKGLKVARDFANNLSCNLVTNTQFIPATISSVKCEWAIAPDSDTSKRIVFFHGGAFLFGSAVGHRKFTDQLSRISNAAVLSVDYRLLPRFARGLSIDDAQKAYLWALENGPNGEGKASFIMVAGDSAGGSLAHMISSWSHNNAPRKPDCVIGFSPSLDQTLSSPLMKANQSSDAILGNALGLLMLLPKTMRLWFLFLSMRYNPSNPLASPVFADLSNLPPTLIHASSNEMLLGDSLRYVNKARAQGSNVRLQVWENQIHDWHLFNMGYGSANVAWNEIAKFISDIQSNANLQT